MARYETGDELAQAIKAALGIRARTRRLIVDLEVGSVPMVYLESIAVPVGGAPGDLSGLGWAQGLQEAKIRDLSEFYLSADLGRVEIRPGDLVVICWPGRLSPVESERISDRLEGALEALGDDIRILLFEGAERFGILALCRAL